MSGRILGLVVYVLDIVACSFVMLHLGVVGFLRWEYWAVLVCLMIARISAYIDELMKKG